MSTIFFTTFTPPSGTAGPEVVGWPPTVLGCDAPEISGTSVRYREPGLANNETGCGSICKPPPEWRPSGGGRGVLNADRGVGPRGRGGVASQQNRPSSGAGNFGGATDAGPGGGFPRALLSRAPP